MGVTLSDLRSLKPGAKLTDGSVGGLYWQANKNSTITGWARVRDTSGKVREVKVSTLEGSFTQKDLMRGRHEAEGFKLNPPAPTTPTIKTLPIKGATVAQVWDEFYRTICTIPNSAWSVDTQEKSLGRITFHVAPRRIWSMPADQVTVRDILQTLQPLAVKPDTQKKVRQLLSKLFKYAHSTGYVDHNPVALVADVQSNMTKAVAAKHQPAVTDIAILQTYYLQIDQTSGDPMVAAALKLQALTAQRSLEVVGAAWSEFNDDRTIWTIPRSRMKMKDDRGDQVLMLSPQATALIRSIPAEDGNPYVFRTKSARSLIAHVSIEALAKRMRAVVGEERTHVPHGWRKALRTNALAAMTPEGSPLFAEAWIESVLDHLEPDKVKRAYTGEKSIVGMGRVLQWWADKLTSKTGGRK